MRFPRASGILLHPTSLPGPHGSGDFGPAAYHFVDWLASAGQRLWQMLPLGAIGPGNSPYMSSSAFAGNPLLVDLAELGQRGWLMADELKPEPAFDDARVRYEQVVPYRMQRLELAAERFAARAGDAERAAFERFCAEQHGWLDDHALFMALGDESGQKCWTGWEPRVARREAAALQAAQARLASRVAFWRFCQWCFHRQWQALKAYANSRGVSIVGDLPIFIAHHSAEVWAHPELFDLDDAGECRVVAGVPPDYFSATGQRWGNPLYRWSRHAADGYAWWVERLRHAFERSDIVRIDHFRGFVDHWEIPAEEPTAVRGRWVAGPGAALFDAIEAALGRRPIIAEDLGIVTDEVHALRRQLGLPGMRILQFAFTRGAADKYLPHHHERDSVVYTGTHDNDTALGWWSSAGEHERHFARAYLATDGHDMPWTLIRAASASVADTAIIPMQDVLALPTSARMNFPGQANGWWAWRLQWTTVHPWHAQRLAEMGRLYGRDGSPA